MKKNILLASDNIYALINYYNKKIIKKSSKYNFFILVSDWLNSDDPIDKEWIRKIQYLKRKNYIKDFYIISKYKKLFFFTFLIVHKILSDLKKINFNKILYSNLSSIELKFIIEKIKKKDNSLLIGHSHGLILTNNLIKKKSIYLNFFYFRTYLKIAEFFLVILPREIRNFIFYGTSNIYFNFKKKYFPLLRVKSDYLISNRPLEVDIYKKYSNNDYKTYLIDELANCSCTSLSFKKKKLLVLLENKQVSLDYMINEYKNKILFLNKKFNFLAIDLKPHPRENTNFPNLLKKILLKENIKVNILPKNQVMLDIICNYKCLIGCSSQLMLDAVVSCSKIIVIGMLNLANRLSRNLSAKNRMGDFDGHCSGILWIDDLTNISNLRARDFIKSSIGLRKRNFQLGKNYKKVNINNLFDI